MDWGMTGMDGKVVAGSDDIDDSLDIGEIDFGVDALCVEIEREVDEVDVACTLAVPKQASLDTVGASQLAKLSSSDTSAYMRITISIQTNTMSVEHTAVIMRVQTDEDLFPF